MVSIKVRIKTGEGLSFVLSTSWFDDSFHRFVREFVCSGESSSSVIPPCIERKLSLARYTDAFSLLPCTQVFLFRWPIIELSFISVSAHVSRWLATKQQGCVGQSRPTTFGTWRPNRGYNDASGHQTGTFLTEDTWIYYGKTRFRPFKNLSKWSSYYRNGQLLCGIYAGEYGENWPSKYPAVVALSRRLPRRSAVDLFTSRSNINQWWCWYPSKEKESPNDLRTC